jgi:OOP family OmpA-OmpF porin
MMKKTKVILFTSLLAAALSAPVAAQTNGGGSFYIGGALGPSKLEEWCDTGGAITLSACEDTDTAWKLLGGYRFNRNFALEGSYIDWGEVTASAGAAAVSANQRSFGVAVLGSFEVAPRFSLFGKVGLLQTEQETKRITPNPSTVDRDETEFHYGFGATYGFTPNLALRAEWEKTEKLKAQLLSVGVEYRF